MIDRAGPRTVPALAGRSPPDSPKKKSQPSRLVFPSRAGALANLGKNGWEAADDLGRLVERETDSEIRSEAVHALGKIDGKKS